MPDEREIRAAERTRLQAIVAEHGTEGERVALLFSGLRHAGVTLKQLAEGGPLGHLSPESTLLAQLSRRAERRERLKFPRVRCAGTPSNPACDCLERALDEPEADGAKAVRKLAGAFHLRPKREPVRPPKQPTTAESSPARPEAKPDPPKPEPTPDPPGRVVHRTRRWYDDSERPSFSDMKF